MRTSAQSGGIDAVDVDEKVKRLMVSWERSVYREIAKQVAAVRQIGKLLVFGSGRELEPELEKQLDEIDKAHTGIDRALVSLRKKIAALGLDDKEVIHRTRGPASESWEAIGWGHAIHTMLAAWAEQVEWAKTLTRLTKRLKRAETKGTHDNMGEPPETMYR